MGVSGRANRVAAFGATSAKPAVLRTSLYAALAIITIGDGNTPQFVCRCSLTIAAVALTIPSMSETGIGFGLGATS